jgi:hypothetical protein
MTAKPEQWRRRARNNLPTLAQRVFALRTKHYPGCGFHWAVERSLGNVVAVLNDYDTPFTIGRQISAEIALEGLYRDVAKAEAA